MEPLRADRAGVPRFARGFVLWDARTILRDMLAVPADDRRRSTVSELLVADLWPGLGHWPHQEPEPVMPRSAKPAHRARVVRIRRRIGRALAR